jgi:putative transposase
MKVVQADIEQRSSSMAKSLAHTKWMCKYYIVFKPKYRRKVIYNQIVKDIIEILKDRCKRNEIEIIEGNAMIAHIHMVVSIPPKLSRSSFMGYMKGKSAMMIFDRHANLKYKFRNRHFWLRGYYVSTVGLNEATIAKYVREQEHHDQMIDRNSVKENGDPFRG